MTAPRTPESPAGPVAGLRLSAAELAVQLARLCPDHHLDLAGAVALPCALPHAGRWRRFLAEERHGGLEYLARDPEDRLDPTRRHAWATTLLVFGQRYTDGWPADDADPSAGGPPGAIDAPPWIARVARYARGLDYHDVFKGDIRAAMDALAGDCPGLIARVAVDSGPYLEREYAWLAGLGFLGRNTCLIHEKLGSGLFLGVALTNLQVSGLPAAGLPAVEPLYAAAPRRRRAAPVAPVTRCGTCTLCLDACPTQAILPGGGLDAGRCLSTWTIEWRGQAPAGRDAEQGGLLFGCDICQAVCPWNRHAARVPATDQPPRAEYAPLSEHAELALHDLAMLPDEAFAVRLRRTPLWRAHPDGLRRNAERVLSNLASGQQDGARDQR